MNLNGSAKMIRIHFGEDDRWHGKPLHEAIGKEARRGSRSWQTNLIQARPPATAIPSND